MREFCYAVAASFFGSLGFAVLFNTRGKRILISAVGGAVFWGLYLVFIHFVDNQYLGFFLSAILITIYAEVWARILKTPATTVLMPTVIPFIPGGALYYAVSAAAGQLLYEKGFFFVTFVWGAALAAALIKRWRDGGSLSTVKK